MNTIHYYALGIALGLMVVGEFSRILFPGGSYVNLMALAPTCQSVFLWSMILGTACVAFALGGMARK